MFRDDCEIFKLVIQRHALNLLFRIP